MTDPVPLSGPVESREQPSDWYGFAAMFVQDHQIEPGGCTCGFCAWSVEHVAVSLAIQLQRMRDADLAAALATIRELRAEAEEANATFDVLRAEMKEASRDKRAAVEAADMIRDLWRDAQAQRDRARSLAATLEDALTRSEKQRHGEALQTDMATGDAWVAEQRIAAVRALCAGPRYWFNDGDDSTELVPTADVLALLDSTPDPLATHLEAELAETENADG